ncbi:hypothetical protein BC826DRAFT_1022504 [Russula brevipes]|nr:hypothetical protein BC826DRAFT_1022504 [Russula brevipes]
MSAFTNAKPSDIPQGDRPPQHHIHNSNEPLPGGHFEGLQPEAQCSDENPQTQSQNAFNSERPLDVLPTQAGGVARGGREDVPMGKASLLDKVVGKAEKVVGKVTQNPERHEAGELREAGGKQAAAGEARAPHD